MMKPSKIKNGAEGGNRIRNLIITSDVLCHLSYFGVWNGRSVDPSATVEYHSLDKEGLTRKFEPVSLAHGKWFTVIPLHHLDTYPFSFK